MLRVFSKIVVLRRDLEPFSNSRKGWMRHTKMSLQVPLTESKGLSAVPSAAGDTAREGQRLRQQGWDWEGNARLPVGRGGSCWDRGAIEHPDDFQATYGYLQREPYANLGVWLSITRDKCPLLPHSKLSSTKRCSTLSLQVIRWRPIQASSPSHLSFLTFPAKGVLVVRLV